MNYQIVGKNILVTKAISEAIQHKLLRVGKYFDPTEKINCRAVVTAYKNITKVEITIFTKEMIFRSEVKNPDLYAGVDLSIDKLEGQMRKLKTKLERKYDQDGLSKSILFEQLKDEDNDDENDTIVKTKNLDLRPITLDDAILQMEAIGHNFYLYLDTDDEKISLVYKRVDGGYGLIQADNKVVL